jgi:hypothetical protein
MEEEESPCCSGKEENQTGFRVTFLSSCCAVRKESFAERRLPFILRQGPCPIKDKREQRDVPKGHAIPECFLFDAPCAAKENISGIRFVFVNDARLN